MALELTVNGVSKRIDDVDPEASVASVVDAMGMKADRVAIECNGIIVRRGAWESTKVQDGDRLEVVHFVGGGLR